MKECDILIIGAGPAGMAAAALAAGQGAKVIMIDEQSAPGGQIYRGLQAVSEQMGEVLGSSYLGGRSLINDTAHANIRLETNATVWRVDPDGLVTFSRDGEAQQVRGRQLIIATGALERPVPLPGWTLPGVMTAGAGQILMKTSGLVATDSVLVGAGPLLYLVASQMIAAGAPPKALVETQTLSNFVFGLKHLTGALRGWRAIIEGLGLLRTIRRAGVRRYRGCTNIRIAGEDSVTAVQFDTGGTATSLPCTTILLHQGVVPNTQITRALGIEHHWHNGQRSFHPVTDKWGAVADMPIYVAGDGAGIGGAKAAAFLGRLSACDALVKIGVLSERERETIAGPLFKALTSERAVRPFLDAVYAPPTTVMRPADDTIICRCEEVTAGDIRRYANLGCTGPNQTKAYGRSGMGLCQGRYCASTVTEILAHKNRQSHAVTGSYRIRSPLKPVTLGELASLDKETVGDNSN